MQTNYVHVDTVGGDTYEYESEKPIEITETETCFVVKLADGARERATFVKRNVLRIEEGKN